MLGMPRDSEEANPETAKRPRYIAKRPIFDDFRWMVLGLQFGMMFAAVQIMPVAIHG